RKPRRALLDVAREGERGTADVVECPATLDPHVDMEAALARRLRPADEPERVERFPDDAADLTHLGPLDARHGIEIDPQLVRMLEILGANRMRMQLEACEIREPDERGRITRHDLLRRASGREAQLDDVDPLGTLLRRTLLIEEFADRKSTRLNSSHVKISYAVFCL